MNIISNNNKTGYLNPIAIDSILNGYEVLDFESNTLHKQQYDAMRNKNKIPHKFSYWEKCISSFRSLWKPIDITYNYTTGGFRFDGKWSLKHNLSVGLTYGLLLIFSVIGWINLYKKNRKLALFFIIILSYHTLIHMLFIPFTRNRYRIPIDFMIIILGSYGMFNTYSYLKLKLKSSRILKLKIIN